VDEHEDTEAYEDEREEEILTPVSWKIEHTCNDDCKHSVDNKTEQEV
jgi:hypothetical protein